MFRLSRVLRSLTAVIFIALGLSAWADDAAIRKNWAERNPKAPPIDEITKTPIPGLYEARFGNEIMYTDEQGNYVLFPSHDQADGHIIDTKSRIDVTEARLSKLNMVDVSSLPLKDAITLKQGSGARRLIVFEDPNCHYCKDVEKNLAALKDVTIHLFLLPILGPASIAKSRDIWCAKEPAKTWRSWMLSEAEPVRAMGRCDASVLDRNTALAQKYSIRGTPAIIFDDGSRFAGAVDLQRIEQRLDELGAAPKKKG